MMNGEDKNDSDEGTQENGAGGRLRNLQLDSLGSIQDDAINYAKHLIPIVAFLVITILAIPGWIICCFCCCCNCCCCCCCKKSGCKIPCFIFTNVFYALVVAVCVYGLSQSNSIFKGMASTECSVLKFFDQILDGETKSEPPRWAGIKGINDILDDLTDQINSLKGTTQGNLNDKYGDINSERTTFRHMMETIGEKFYEDNHYKSIYLKPDDLTSPSTPTTYNYNFNNYKTGQNYNVQGKYVLDLVKMFGRYKSEDNSFYPQGSVLHSWNQEYALVSQNADPQLDNAHSSFNSILNEATGDVVGQLNKGKNTLDELKGSFDGIKGSIADVIIENSETIDHYGKLGFKVVFGVLALINIAIAVFMFLLCFFSGKLCINCCCCRCICKCATHLLWNILALLMIITFLIGFLFTLIGQLGSDLMSVISFVVSEDNLLASEGSILVDTMGQEAKGYLVRCIIGDGKIEKELGLDIGQIESFDKIYDAENIINQAKDSFQIIRAEKIVYNNYKNEINKRESLEIIPSLISVDRDYDILNFATILDEMNKAIEGQTDLTDSQKAERWGITYPETNICEEGSTSDGTITGSQFNPKKCMPYDRDWIFGLTETDYPHIKGRAKILSDTMDLVKKANDEQTSTTDQDSRTSFLAILNVLERGYDTYLEKYIDALDEYKKAIKKITGKLKEFTGENNGLFSFIKCSFIGTNLKIMLKYLKSALG
jgi:hypothetical protein